MYLHWHFPRQTIISGKTHCWNFGTYTPVNGPIFPTRTIISGKIGRGGPKFVGIFGPPGSKFSGPKFRQEKGSEFLENHKIMPGGAIPSQVYNLQEQPGRVKVCIQKPATPTMPPGLESKVSTMVLDSRSRKVSYVPTCSQDLLSEEYSVLKLAGLVNRSLPLPSKEAFKLFPTSHSCKRGNCNG